MKLENKYTKERICCDCGKRDIIRKDSRATRCVKCSSLINAKKSAIIKHNLSKNKKCIECGSMYSGQNKKYCSISCRKNAEKKLSEKRSCKSCNKSFSVLTSSLNTNASGNFCSRGCYESYLCNTDRKTGRGSQWKKIRNSIVKKIPFCVMCGTNKNIQVHHIIPFRLTFNNNINNLIPLCTKHHKKIEYITIDVLRETGDYETARYVLRSILAEFGKLTLMKLKGL